MQNYPPVQPQIMPQMQPPIQFYAVPPKAVYAQGLTQTPAPITPNQTAQPLGHIPLEQDVLSLSTKPDNKIFSNETQNITSIDTKLNAQMPKPDIQAPSGIENAPQEAPEEKPLPSLNIGVVDAPNNGTMTPIMDDLNARAEEFESEYPLQIAAELPKEESIVPKTLGKKPMSAGKLSAGLSLGALGLTFILLIPKGISKIIKLIKHK